MKKKYSNYFTLNFKTKITLTFALFSVIFGVSLNAQTIHFQDEFTTGNTLGWTTNDQDADGFDWGFGDLTGLGTVFDAQAGVAFSSSYDNTAGALTPNNYLISPAINLATAGTTVNLSFKLGSTQTTASGWQEEYVSVYVVTNPSIASINTATPVYSQAIVTGEVMQLSTFNISSFSGQGAVYLAFRHHNCTDEFQVILDEVKVQSTGGAALNDIAILKRYAQNVETGFDYSIVPNSQRQPLEVGVSLINNGSAAVTNKTLSITINDGTSNVYTGTQTFSALAGETKYVWKTTNFTPAIDKNYVVTFTLPSDDVASNNTGTASFKTQANVYAHDYTSTDKVGFNINDEVAIGNYYKIFNNETLYSLDVEFETGTTPGMAVTIKVFNLISFNTEIASANYTVTAGNIGNGIVTNIPLSAPLQLNAGNEYIVYVSKVNNSNRLFIGASTFGADDYSTYYYGPFGAGGAVGHYQDNAKAPFVRMNFALGCSGFTSVFTPQASQSCSANTGQISCSTSGTGALANQYTYSWTGTITGTSGPNQAADYTITNLAPGTYNVTVTNNGCSFSSSSQITIGSVTSPTISTSNTPISCYGMNDGSVSYATVGDISGYTFNWSNGSTSSTLTNLTAGVYTITASNGICNLTSTTTLQAPTEIVITPTITNVTACGLTNGIIVLNVTGGTAANYLYTWTGATSGSSGAGFGNSFTMNTLPAGNYEILVTNGNCQSTIVAAVSSSGAPNITINQVTPISCNGSLNGSLNVTATSSITAYTFTWNTGATGILLSNIGSGFYSVTGTNGTCIITESYEFIEPQQLLVNGNVGVSEIITNVTGGTGNISYSWSGPNGFTSTNSNLFQLAVVGNYVVTVTDQNGCTDAQSFVLSLVGNDEIVKVENLIRVYPNPASQSINFEVSEEVKLISITDFTGKIVNNLLVENGKLNLNVALLNDGMYFYSLYNATGEKLVSDKFSVIK